MVEVGLVWAWRFGAWDWVEAGLRCFCGGCARACASGSSTFLELVIDGCGLVHDM